MTTTAITTVAVQRFIGDCNFVDKNESDYDGIMVDNWILGLGLLFVAEISIACSSFYRVFYADADAAAAAAAGPRAWPPILCAAQILERAPSAVKFLIRFCYQTCSFYCWLAVQSLYPTVCLFL